MSRIGLLGGSFNPVHLGHLIVAQDAWEQFGLDQVWLVPCAAPPHKPLEGLAEARHRVAMLELAVAGDPRLAVSRIEVERGGISYSVDTVRALRAMHPGTDFFFVVGSDTLLELSTWREIASLLELCTVVALERPGFERSRLRPEMLRLPEPWPARLLERVARGHAVEISSSDIRRRVAQGRSIQFLVPAAVAGYIFEQKLYTS